MSGPWAKADVVRRTDWAEGLMSLEVDAPLSPFSPGQFVQLGVNVDGDRIERPYSLASPPSVNPEFLLNRVPEGVLTPHLFELEPGKSVGITTRPAGQFTLDWVRSAPLLWMIATGTGLAPYMSILRAREVWHRFARVILVHAVRIPAHFAYREELMRLAEAKPRAFSRIEVVSRDPSAKGALIGRIPKLLDDGGLEDRAHARITRETSQVMLSGNPDMIKETRARLETRGLVRNRLRAPGQITTEAYW
jgi:ferredoxin--NADP+ reductase